MTAIPLLGPLTDDNRAGWLTLRQRGIGASDIATVLKLPGAYSSPFALWWAKKLGWRSEQTEEMEWGHRLEGAVAAKFQDEHPDLDVTVPGSSLWRHPDIPWALCTPDRFVSDGYTEWPLELKTDQNAKRWGDEPPAIYRAQLMWQCFVFGVDRGWLAVLVGKTYHEYALTFTQVEMERAAGEAALFMASLDKGEPPWIDESEATTVALAALHSDIIDKSVSLDPNLIRELRVSYDNMKAAKEALRYAENLILDALGDAAEGHDHEGRRVVKRVRFPRAGYTVPPTVVTQLRKYLGEEETE